LVYVHQEQSYVGELSGDLDTSAYHLHHVFPPQTVPRELFEEMVEPMLEQVLVDQEHVQQQEEKEERGKKKGKEKEITDHVFTSTGLLHSPVVKSLRPVCWCISFGMTGSGKYRCQYQYQQHSQH